MLAAACLVCMAALFGGQAGLDSGPSAVRLGGIGTGWIEWRGSEGFGATALSQNHAYPIAPQRGSFLAVWTKAQGRTTARVLARSSHYGLPCSEKLAPRHAFPFASLASLDDDLPVTVSVELFAPVIPYDVTASSLPAVPIVFTVRNVWRAPVEVAVAVSWETVLGLGGASGLGPFSLRRGITARALPTSAGVAGISFMGPELEDEPVADLRMHNARGSQALLTRFPSPDADVTVCAWDPAADAPRWWNTFKERGSVTEDEASQAGTTRDVAGAVAVRLDMKANETREIPFVIAWHSPRIYDRHGADFRPLYAGRFANAEAVGRFVLEDRGALRALASEWQTRLSRSVAGEAALPKLSVELEEAMCVTQWVAQGEGQAPSAALIGSGEDGADQSLSLERRFRMQSALLALFPELDAADIEWRLATASARRLLQEEDDRLSADVAVLAAAHVRATSNRAWLSAIWPRLREAAIPALGRLAERRASTRTDVEALLDLATLANDADAAAFAAGLGEKSPDSGRVGAHTPSAWDDWRALIGCEWNPERQELVLAPRLGPTQSRLSGPIFLPGYWAWCEWRQLPSRTTVEVRLDRVMPMRVAPRRLGLGPSLTTPLAVRQVTLRLPRRHTIEDVRVAVGGAPTACTARQGEGGRIEVSLDPPVTVGPGDRITVEVMLESGR